jgi:hypothetical protein
MKPKELTEFITMKEDIKHIKIDMGEIKATLNDFIKNADRKYAGKWTEKIIWSMGGIVGAAILIAILEGVIK